MHKIIKSVNTLFFRFATVIICLIFATVISGCNSSSSISGSEEQDSITSGITDTNYPINIYLPASYESSNRDFPVLYVTDAEWRYLDVRHEVERRQIQVIIIGIGNSDREPLGRRAIDYLLPGSLDYYQFLSNELLPYIESMYRISPENRSIFGHSYGGLLISSILFMEDPSEPFFHNYIAADPSLFYEPERMHALEEQRLAISQNLSGNLIITGATAGGNGSSVNTFVQWLSESDFQNVNVTNYSYDTDHMGCVQPSISDALDLIFPPE